MKKITILLMLTMALPSLALAGEVYGIVKKGGKPVGGLEVEIHTWRETERKPYIAKTDKQGSYSIFIKERGKFKLRVCLSEKEKETCTPTIVVFSYKRPIKYNLMVEKDKEGKYQLRRR